MDLRAAFEGGVRDVPEEVVEEGMKPEVAEPFRDRGRARDVEEHDETVAYSLSIPFVSTFVFAAVMKHQDAPGTTFKRHMAIAQGVLSEDDFLLQEILFNPRTPAQVENIRTELNELLDIISRKDAEGMHAYLSKIRKNIK